MFLSLLEGLLRGKEKEGKKGGSEERKGGRKGRREEAKKGKEGGEEGGGKEEGREEGRKRRKGRREGRGGGGKEGGERKEEGGGETKDEWKGGEKGGKDSSKEGRKDKQRWKEEAGRKGERERAHSLDIPVHEACSAGSSVLLSYLRLLRNCSTRLRGSEPPHAGCLDSVLVQLGVCPPPLMPPSPTSVAPSLSACPLTLGLEWGTWRNSTDSGLTNQMNVFGIMTGSKWF